MDQGGENVLIKLAIFCIAMSMISTILFAVYSEGSSDYDYAVIQGYKEDLVDFSGGQLVNDNPWVLKGVYTPFTPGTVPNSDIPNHIEDDNGQSIGWLYGDKITDYPYLDESANIKLDPLQKSDQLLTIGNATSYEYANELEWWNGGNDLGMVILDPTLVRNVVNFFGGNISDNYGYVTETVTANNWNYTGYRYVFDPVLPFNNQGSAKDGRLSLVWYETAPHVTGLSGALEIYGTSKDRGQVKLGSIAADDIVNTFSSTSGYVHVFDFNFEGTHLNLTIRFDPTVYNDYNSLGDAWYAGAWSMAVSSASAGNFFDVENSNAFNATAGSMLDTFIQIYTFDYPHFNDKPWLEIIMWLLVGLPMTLGMLFITARLVGGVFKIF